MTPAFQFLIVGYDHLSNLFLYCLAKGIVGVDDLIQHKMTGDQLLRQDVFNYAFGSLPFGSRRLDDLFFIVIHPDYHRWGVFVSATRGSGLPVSGTGPPSSSQRRIFSITRLLLSDEEAGFTHASTLP
jgi:hypothetical protein